MSETIQLGKLSILVTRKDIKNVHLSVYPPDGRVTLVAPVATRLDVARAYASSRLGWIRQQQAKLKSQARETPRKFIERESHNCGDMAGMRPRSIKIFLLDGDPAGIRDAQISMSTIHAIAFRKLQLSRGRND